MKLMRMMVLLMVPLFLVGCVSMLYPEPASPSEEAVQEIHVPITKVSTQHQQSSSSSSQQEFPLQITATVTHPAQILGKAGFSPSEFMIETGDSVTWRNDDPQRKVATLVIHQENTRHFITSPTIKYGEEWENVFTMPAEYSYWTVEYGVKGKLRVKED